MRLQVTELKESNDLLNLLMSNINSAVFLTDSDVRLQDFNNTLEKLFSKTEQDMLHQLCGNAIGCAFAVEEQALCGEASHCPNCVVRNSILKALDLCEPTLKEPLHRKFYIGGSPVDKYFQFSVQRISHNHEPMIMVEMDDLTELESQRVSLLEKQKRLDEDLRAAAGIQQSLLPQSFPRVQACSFGANFVPCAHIGGDIFNVFEPAEGHVALYMIDVSGHGVASSLVTVSVSQILHPQSSGVRGAGVGGFLSDNSFYASPSQILQMLDQEYPFERFDKYFTIAYLVLDTRTGELRYSSGGHPFPVLIRSNGSLELLEAGGPLIGLGSMVPFEEGRTFLNEDERLVIYTDGVTEYFDQKGNMFGEDRFYRCLEELKTKPPQAMLDELHERMLAFGANNPPQDDISVLAMDYHGAISQ